MTFRKAQRVSGISVGGHRHHDSDILTELLLSLDVRSTSVKERGASSSAITGLQCQLTSSQEVLSLWPYEIPIISERYVRAQTGLLGPISIPEALQKLKI